MDFQINDTMFVITPEVSQACLQLEALDDSAVEDPEEVIVTIAMDGVLIGNTTIIISDNDGVYILLLLCVHAKTKLFVSVCVRV